MENKIICYGQVKSGNWIQEHYETKSRDAGKRARALRKLGYEVISSALGNQITNVGSVKITMLTILPGKNIDTSNLPFVKIERI